MRSLDLPTPLVRRQVARHNLVFRGGATRAHGAAPRAAGHTSRTRREARARSDPTLPTGSDEAQPRRPVATTPPGSTTRPHPHDSPPSFKGHSRTLALSTVRNAAR